MYGRPKESKKPGRGRGVRTVSVAYAEIAKRRKRSLVHGFAIYANPTENTLLCGGCLFAIVPWKSATGR